MTAILFCIVKILEQIELTDWLIDWLSVYVKVRFARWTLLNRAMYRLTTSGCGHSSFLMTSKHWLSWVKMSVTEQENNTCSDAFWNWTNINRDQLWPLLLLLLLLNYYWVVKVFFNKHVLDEKSCLYYLHCAVAQACVRRTQAPPGPSEIFG